MVQNYRQIRGCSGTGLFIITTDGACGHTMFVFLNVCTVFGEMYTIFNN